MTTTPTTTCDFPETEHPGFPCAHPIFADDEVAIDGPTTSHNVNRADVDPQTTAYNVGLYDGFAPAGTDVIGSAALKPEYRESYSRGYWAGCEVRIQHDGHGEALAGTTKRMREAAATKDDGLSWMTPQEREAYRWDKAMGDDESRAFDAMGF